jgi:hypothetical protein
MFSTDVVYKEMDIGVPVWAYYHYFYDFLH